MSLTATIYPSSLPRFGDTSFGTTSRLQSGLETNMALPYGVTLSLRGGYLFSRDEEGATFMGRLLEHYANLLADTIYVPLFNRALMAIT